MQKSPAERAFEFRVDEAVKELMPHVGVDLDKAWFRLVDASQKVLSSYGRARAAKDPNYQRLQDAENKFIDLVAVTVNKRTGQNLLPPKAKAK